MSKMFRKLPLHYHLQPIYIPSKELDCCHQHLSFSFPLVHVEAINETSTIILKFLKQVMPN